ncbi:MAG TPA: DUF433 domain-containing protein [Blastocatellia bacterium]|nr:DUF433 domain-containing protein [Blastocatellia bacterium]
MSKEYVTRVGGAYRISGTRVSLDSVVYAWLEGLSPESIVESYPALTLEQVHGALAYYLAHQQEIDRYLRLGEAQFEELRAQTTRRLRETNPLLFQKLVAHCRLGWPSKN